MAEFHEINARLLDLMSNILKDFLRAGKGRRYGQQDEG
jgi:hypothetical protein